MCVYYFWPAWSCAVAAVIGVAVGWTGSGGTPLRTVFVAHSLFNRYIVGYRWVDVNMKCGEGGCGYGIQKKKKELEIVEGGKKVEKER